MAANSAEKLNRAGRSPTGYFSRPLDLKKIGGERVCASKRAIASMIRGYSKNGKPFEATYNEIAEHGHFSRATAGRGVRWIKDNELFKRGEKVYQYYYTEKVPEHEKYVIIYEWLYEAEFEMGTEKLPVRLTPTEVEVLSLIRGYSPNGYRSTQNTIAKELGVSKSTVSAAVRLLEAVGAIRLIYEEGHARAENKHVKTIFRANEKLINKKRSEVVKRVSRGKSEAVQVMDENAAREAYYRGRQRAEERRIEELEGKLRCDSEYDYAADELRKLEHDVAVAEYKRNYNELTRLLAHRQAMTAQKLARMELMGVSEVDLERRYSCKECRDTGVRADYTYCDCWRRSPR